MLRVCIYTYYHKTLLRPVFETAIVKTRVARRLSANQTLKIHDEGSTNIEYARNSVTNLRDED